ncbi:MAG: DEAD/DEAH box helicase [Myxococcota bacterium]
MKLFGPATRAWFDASFEAPTLVQKKGWPKIAKGEHSLLIAPTGSGKTLAAFLWCIDQISRTPPPGTKDEPKGVKALYVSPLKALVYDVERNLRAPLVGISAAAQRVRKQIRIPSVGVRTGDTPQRERQAQLRDPPDILVTTPESLYLLLIGQARLNLQTVETVIIDEVHALCPTKRGAHMALSLERLAAGCIRDPQRIGLSATATPLEEVAKFLGGDRDVTIVDTSAPPKIDLSITVPVPDMTRPGEHLRAMATEDEGIDLGGADDDDLDAAAAGFDDDDDAMGPFGGGAFEPSKDDDTPADDGGPVDYGSGKTVVQAQPAMFEPMDNSIWPAIYPRLLELIDKHQTTIIFVNSRGLCERLSQRLLEQSGQPDLVRAHHGSVAREQREQIEEMLKTGQIRCIVATSSLELGIDMGAVDLVVLVESPGAVSRGLQRIGRAGHGVGEVSKGRIFPKHRGDLLECVVLSERMRGGEIEPIAYPRNPLDVLAQQMVAMTVVEDQPLHEVKRIVKRAANFEDLPPDAFSGVLDMLAGRYPSHAFADLRPRITWDRDADVLSTRRGSKQVAVFNAGTIPDRGTYSVHLGDGGPRLGELDEEMVHESAAGQNITLGATTWKVEQITRDRVIVAPAPGEQGRLPFWRGDGPGRPAALGRAMGKFAATLARKKAADAEAWLQSEYALDAYAAQNLVTYVHEQREATGTLPTDKRITVERFRDELGDWRICILSPLGARVHAPWALAIQARLESHFGFEVQAMWSDDGIVLRLVEVEEVPDVDVLLPDPDEVEEQVVEQLAHSALFAGQFRENAGRALLLPRMKAGARTPLWQQRLKSQQLLAVAREFPSFPIIIETYRACLKDVFDLPELIDTLRGIARRDIKVDVVETQNASPFARSLVFAYVAAYLYEGDSPLAERKAQALALDRKLLRELLGQEELRELLDAAVIEQIEAELQAIEPEYRARHVDAMHDVLRKVGDLTLEEAQLRSVDDCEPWLASLVKARRAVALRVAGEQRYVAVEDASLYRDAVGSNIPVGVPKVFLQTVPDAWLTLVKRYARTHAPFTAQALADRYDVPVERALETLTLLERDDDVLRGEFRPDRAGEEWCHPDVLRRIKRHTLAKLRGEIAPVDAESLGRFLPRWHGIGQAEIGPAKLEEALAQLEGLPLSWKELETVILPDRVPGFHARMLDELGAMGWLVWVGRGAIGKTDGRVAFYRRERAAVLLEQPELPEDLEPMHHQLLDALKARGACFFTELQTACGPGARVKEVREALWDLVWEGLVTNDTFAALRSLLRPQKPRGRSLRGGLSASTGLGGRWSLVESLIAPDVPETQRAHARAVTLLERHGVVTREVATLEPMQGGFSAVYRVLRAMEDSGKIRRGYFVEGLGGAQFASAGAVDRLRATKNDEDDDVVVLSAIDPANPYGWMLPWPYRNADKKTGPRRVPGASVVLVGGVVALFVDKGGKKMTSFPAADDPQVALQAARALAVVAKRQRGKLLRIETIDGEPARTSPMADCLREAAFTSDPRGLMLEA